MQLKAQRWARVAVLFVWAAMASSAALAAQSPDSVQAQQSAAPFEQIRLTVGRSHVMTSDFEVTRIAVTNPAIADAVRVTAREILIDGKGPGTTSLILWGGGQRIQYNVIVDVTAPPLQTQMETIFPGEDIHVSTTEEAVVLSGYASTNNVALRAQEIVQASHAKLKVINLLQWDEPGPPQIQQVMLEVRFAEVEHNALVELGASFIANRPDVQTGGATGQFPVPFINESAPGQLGNGTVGVPGGADQVIHVPNASTDFLNLFFFLRRDGLLAVLKALKQRGKFQNLAEPNLIAYNGQEASFLAGGEVPIPLVQGNSGQVTVQYKEFGVRLTFKPTITGEVIRLKVRPEVSTLDFANGLTLAGFKVPALKTRRAETDVELRDGQSFAIAGLLNNQSSEDRQSIPFLSSLPVVGNLFKSKSDSAARTELLVLITPHLVRPMEPSEVPPLPIDFKPFLKPSGGPGPMLEGGGGLVDGPSPKPVVKEKKQ